MKGTSRRRAEIAVVGSGFAGAILARVLHRLGRDVVLVEKGSHPRFAIGESSTPLANLGLERLSRRYGLADLWRLATHGRWLETHGHLRRGLKRGFTFYQHRRGELWRNGPANQARLLVAASPDDRVADTHWLRADFDAHMVATAVAEGVDYRDRTLLERAELGARRQRLAGNRQGEPVEIVSDLVVDASGPGGFLARALPIASVLDQVPVSTHLVYGHFLGVRDFAEAVAEQGEVFEPGPYPDDRAAVHHLLDGAWMYDLPFDPEPGAGGRRLASLGFVVANRSGVAPPRTPDEALAAWNAWLAAYPSIAAQLAGAEAVRPVAAVPRVQHRLARGAGPGWVLLPHAFAFYDPLFSTGIAWSLRAIERLGDLLSAPGPAAGALEGGTGQRYESLLQREADQIEALVEGAWLALGDFRLFIAFSLLYFAAVSFAESRLRLLGDEAGAGGGDPGGGPRETRAPVGGERPPPGPWEGFLGASDPLVVELFATALQRLRALRRRWPAGEIPGVEAAAFEGWVAEAIAPRNVAGLAEPARRNLYPADLEILVERAHLLGLTPADVRAALPRLRGG